MRRPVALLAAVAVSLLVPAAASAAPASRSSSQPVYLALGDSVAFGVGALPEPGYVPLLAEELRDSAICLPDAASRRARGCQQLQLVNLSRGGATTKTLIENQLPEAVRLLEQRNQDRNPRNDVEVITITIGGNDVNAAFSALVAACGSDPTTTECTNLLGSILQGYRERLTVILDSLREAAGDDTTIVTTAYYNPFPACDRAQFAPLADAVLQQLNAVTRTVSDRYGAEVADAFGQLDVDDYVGGEDCLHPDASGHAVLADIFADAILG